MHFLIILLDGKINIFKFEHSVSYVEVCGKVSLGENHGKKIDSRK